MEQITFEGWVKEQSRETILSDAVLGAVYETDDAEQSRRDGVVSRQAELLGYTPEEIRKRHWAFLERLEAADDEQAFLRKLAQGRFVTTPLSFLHGASLPETKWVVDGILPQGLCVLAAPPKMGKSWLALDLCLSVASGRPFLGLRTSGCKVMYLALEDSVQRIRKRTETLLGESTWPENVRVCRDAPTLHGGLPEALRKHCREVPGTGLVVIDTLQKIRGVRMSQDVYGSDYADLGLLKELADSLGICLLLVHHTRKSGDEADPFNCISGSNGIAGSADTQWVISRQKRMTAEADLHITGRDVNAETLRLEFSSDTCRWTKLGTGRELSERRSLDEMERCPVCRTAWALTQEGPWQGTMGDFSREMDRLEIPKPDTNLRGLSVILKNRQEDLEQYWGIRIHTQTRGTAGKQFHLERVNAKNAKMQIISPREKSPV